MKRAHVTESRPEMLRLNTHKREFQAVDDAYAIISNARRHGIVGDRLVDVLRLALSIAMVREGE